MKFCVIENCAKKILARGLCSTHYWKWNTFGDALYEGPHNRAARIRAAAIASGENTYRTGLLCLRGHVSDRKIGGMCIACSKQIARDRYKADPSKSRAATAKWMRNNPQKQRDAVRRWDKNNRDRKNEHRARRRALEQQALPAWADRTAIDEIYEEARYHGLVVDHIVPLNHRFVCGLHVEHNLQLLTDAENKQKSNRFDPWTTV